MEWLAFSPDSKFIACASDSKTTVWRIQKDSAVKEAEIEATGEIERNNCPVAALSNNAKHIAISRGHLRIEHMDVANPSSKTTRNLLDELKAQDPSFSYKDGERLDRITNMRFLTDSSVRISLQLRENYFFLDMDLNGGVTLKEASNFGYSDTSCFEE